MQIENILIRRETAADIAPIRSVEAAAFGRPDEADLVDRLRDAHSVLVSLVAERRGVVIGHILLSRISIETADETIPSVALAPLAVSPAHQGRGIGTRLVEFGLERLRAHGERSVLVLGDPKYYRRFGFSADGARALITPFPAHAFMALELVTKALEGIRGTVRYPASFGL